MKTKYVTVPVASKPELRVAESTPVIPTTILEEDRAVARVGLALLTVRGSQGEAAPLLFESPLYTAFQL